MGGVAGQAQCVVAVGRLLELVTVHHQRGRPAVQGMGVMAGVAGQLFIRVVDVSRAQQLRQLLGMRPAVGLVRPGVERSILPVVIQRRQVVVEVEGCQIVDARDKVSVAEGVLVSLVEGVLEDTHRRFTLAGMRCVTLATELITCLGGQILRADDCGFVGASDVFRARAMTVLAGNVEILVVEGRDDGLVGHVAIDEVLRSQSRLRSVTTSAVSRQGIRRLGPGCRRLLPELRDSHLRFGQDLGVGRSPVLHHVHGHERHVVLLGSLHRHVVLFHPGHQIRHVLDARQVALFAFAEVGVVVRQLVVRVDVALAPVALAADRAGHRNEERCGILRTVQFDLLCVASRPRPVPHRT